MLKVRVRRAARLDFRAAVGWLKEQELPELALDLARQYRATVERARRLPRAGTLLTDLPEE